MQPHAAAAGCSRGIGERKPHGHVNGVMELRDICRMERMLSVGHCWTGENSSKVIFALSPVHESFSLLITGSVVTGSRSRFPGRQMAPFQRRHPLSFTAQHVQLLRKYRNNRHQIS
eukprot:s381_g21.t1